MTSNLNDADIILLDARAGKDRDVLLRSVSELGVSTFPILMILNITSSLITINSTWPLKYLTSTPVLKKGRW